MDFQTQSDLISFGGARLTAFLLALLWLAVGSSGCSRSQAPPVKGTPSVGATQTAATTPIPDPDSSNDSLAANPELAKAKAEVCGLLSSRAVQSIQGERTKEAKASAKMIGGLKVTQCFYTLPTFTKSISLTITKRGEGKGARDPSELWRETFGSDEDAEKHGEDRKSDHDEAREKKGVRAESEEEEESYPPKPIKGLGNEAFWLGNAVGGALYALKGNVFVRISIGGAADQRTKINKSKAVARAVLQNL